MPGSGRFCGGWSGCRSETGAGCWCRLLVPVRFRLPLRPGGAFDRGRGDVQRSAREGRLRQALARARDHQQRPRQRVGRLQAYPGRGDVQVGQVGAAERAGRHPGGREFDHAVQFAGGGGSALAFGGAGGHTAGALKVTPGETLSVAVAARGFGDARGGASGSTSAGAGGNSTAIRTSDGDALVIAAGGGGAAHGRGPDSQGYAGAAGGEKGQDASETAFGGKGADKGTAGAGGGNGASGGNISAGGRGGNGGKGGEGSGGAGYAGGGGGAGAPDTAETGGGGGGGGSSYANPDRVSLAYGC
ncbi:hypothetical protein SALBM311S_01709 [Streptomyces alboniger]